ncbi:MAG: TonB-dependent receptor plug domain-containing protein, partial [Pseudomonadota bacterium]
VAISVVQAEEIERAEIQDLNDLQTLVPSLTVRQTQSSSNTSFFIRGFGNGANAIGLEPSVGIFIDGVFRSRAAAYIPDLPNLERVEVLRGPQSTLFGKNASAGVVSVVTQAPQFEQQGSVEASVGNYNAFRAKADITGPLNDRLAYGLSGSINTRDGYVEDVGTGDEYNERNRWGLRGDLLFTPSETVEFRFIADYDKIDEKCCLIGNIVEADEPGAAIVAAGGSVVSEDIFSYEVFYDTPPTNEIENYGFSLQGDYDLVFATLTTISAKRYSEEDAVLDADATSLDFLVSNTGTQIGTFTQEVRLASNPNEESRFDWMVGGFFFDETIEQDNSVLFGTDYRNFLSALLGDAGGIPAGQAQIAGLEAFAGVTPGSSFAQAGQGSFEDIQQDNQAWSAFGTVDVHITDRLTATLGLNYTTDEKEVVMDVVSTDALAAVNIDQLGYTATLQGLLAAQGVTLTDPTSIVPFIQGNPAAYAQLQQQAVAVAQNDANPFGGLRAVQIFHGVREAEKRWEDLNGA